jgi:hypothetical protein
MKSYLRYNIPEDFVLASSAALDVFTDQFDAQWARSYPYSSMATGSRIFSVHPAEYGQEGFSGDDGKVEYSYNSDWFRCDEFSKTHNKDFHVLFGGCSETEGVASPIEEVWSKMLHSKIKKSFSVDNFYSIAMAGYGWQKIISSFMTYVKKYGFPTHFFVLIPNLQRFFSWDKKAQSWDYHFGKPLDRLAEDVSKEEEEAAIEQHKNLLINFTINWRLFEHYCETNGVKLLWSTWDFLEDYNFSILNQFNNYFTITEKDYDDFIYKVAPDGKIVEGDLFRRDGHSGRIYHMYLLECFKNEITKRNLFPGGFGGE